MNRTPEPPDFAEVLVRLDERLDLPQPARTRLLLEIAADLEDLAGAHVAAGAAPDEARRRAVETLDLTEGTLRELAAVHASPLRRALDQLSARGRGGVERALQGLLLAVVLAASAVPLLGGGLLASAGPYGLGLAGLAVVAAALFVRKAWALWVVQDHDPRRVRAGALPVLVVAAIALGAGTIGYSASLGLATLRLAEAPDRVVPLLAGWILRGSAFLIVSFLVALGSGLLWFVLEGKIARIEEAEMSLRLRHRPETGSPS